MNAESLQTMFQVMVVIGITLTALGGFGSYHFGKKSGDARAREFQQSVDELLTRSQTLEDKLEPFHELAQTARPDLDQDAALDSLRQEIEQLREIAAKHEFTPLSPELRNKFLRRVQEFAPSFATAGFSILITHETWSPQTTRQYATHGVAPFPWTVDSLAFKQLVDYSSRSSGVTGSQGQSGDGVDCTSLRCIRRLPCGPRPGYGIRAGR